MKLTKEFIELQGFESHKVYDKHLHVFAIENGGHTYELIWDIQTNLITIFKFSEEDDDNEEENEIFCDFVHTAFQFIKMLIQVDELTNKGVSFPNDFVKMFYRSRYPYTEQEFNEMCEACIVILLAKEEYEECPKLIAHRKKYINRKGWQYAELKESLIKSYADVTTDLRM